MAAITPNLDPSVAGFVDPRMGLFGGVATTTNNLNTDVNQRISNRNNLELRIFHFGTLVTNDTWTSNIRNIVACAFQSEDATDDRTRATLTTQSTGVITFDAIGTDAGWLWILIGGVVN